MYLTVFILLGITICHSSTSSQQLLDVDDYSFYFKTSHYEFTEITPNHEISIENDVNLNIDINKLTIDFIQNKESVLSLDISNDDDWNEISIISSIDNDNDNDHISTIEYDKYIAIDKSLNYNDAQLYCNQYYYGNLVTITTSKENSVISKLCTMLPSNKNCWIGLRNPLSNKWLNNEDIIYNNIEYDPSIHRKSPLLIILDIKSYIEN